ncbi:hypothetical protein PQX77_002001 [Marasmius sp. AFHP31]|nr:hypothetical protein PQX77_002001 [Marasmius sp. AFHP31]
MDDLVDSEGFKANLEDKPLTRPGAGNLKEKYPTERYPLRLNELLLENISDPAVVNFKQDLRAHLLDRLFGLSGDVELSRSLALVKDRIYIHRTRCIRQAYNIDNLSRKGQTSKPRTHPEVMLLADEVTAREEGLSICPNYRYISRERLAKRLPKVRFVPADDPQAFVFVDPARVLRGAFLEPAFEDGFDHSSATIGEVLGEDSVCRLYHSYHDGKLASDAETIVPATSTFLMIDLVMRHHGGGVGHSADVFIRELELEAPSNDKLLPIYDPATREMLEDVSEDSADEHQPVPHPDVSESTSSEGSSPDEPGPDLVKT